MQCLQPNSILQGGKYKIVRFLSSGGFGNTYEGVHTMMDTRVAIKEFFPKMFCNRDESTLHVTVATQGNRELVDKLRKKFNEEAKSVFQMNHPNIVRVLDIFEENGTAYYVMEYIDGKSLNDITKERGALPEAEAVGYIRQVADALKYVHSLNRLHLDIKPGNIMVDKNGKAILIDFGASKHYDDESGENTSTLMGVNTKGYAPIEQSTQSFTSFSPATDIYALGATLYKLLTGIVPPDANLLMAEEETLQPLPNGISTPTRNAVMAAIQLRRKDRPQSVGAWLNDQNISGSSVVDTSSSTNSSKHYCKKSPNDDEVTHVESNVEWQKENTHPEAVEEARNKAEEESYKKEEELQLKEKRKRKEAIHKDKEGTGIREEKKQKASKRNIYYIGVNIAIVLVAALYIYSNCKDLSSNQYSSSKIVDDAKVQRQADSQIAYKNFTVSVNSCTISSKVHDWTVVSVKGTKSNTIVKKRCIPHAEHTLVWSDTSEFIEDCNTGTRYYLKRSDIGTDQSDGKVLMNSNIFTYCEYYPSLPPSVTMINISDGENYYATNVRIR